MLIPHACEVARDWLWVEEEESGKGRWEDNLAVLWEGGVGEAGGGGKKERNWALFNLGRSVDRAESSASRIDDSAQVFFFFFFLIGVRLLQQQRIHVPVDNLSQLVQQSLKHKHKGTRI